MHLPTIHVMKNVILAIRKLLKMSCLSFYSVQVVSRRLGHVLNIVQSETHLRCLIARLSVSMQMMSGYAHFDVRPSGLLQDVSSASSLSEWQRDVSDVSIIRRLMTSWLSSLLYKLYQRNLNVLVVRHPCYKTSGDVIFCPDTLVFLS